MAVGRAQRFAHGFLLCRGTVGRYYRFLPTVFFVLLRGNDDDHWREKPDLCYEPANDEWPVARR